MQAEPMGRGSPAPPRTGTFSAGEEGTGSLPQPLPHKSR